MGFYWGGELIIMLEIVPVQAGVFCILSREKMSTYFLYFDCCSYSGSQNKDGQALHTIFVEYIEGMRLFLESESDKDSPTLQEIRLHYAGFVHRLIRSISREYSPCL